MLKQRVYTALILAPLALLGVFALPFEWFIYLLDAAIILAAWEWANLSGYQKQSSRFFYMAVMAVVVAAAHLFYPVLPIDLILSGALLGWLVALYWVVRFPVSEGWNARWQRGVIGVVVLLPCWLAFVSLKGADQGEWLILLLFLLVWGADVGAYVAGKNFGRVKLAVRVSPGKTREGFYGGLLVCLVVALAFALFNDMTLLQTLLLMLLGLLTGMISVLGDLFESMLKRHRGIKDSSQLLPGHGGILDRIDSLTAASPLFVLGMQYLVSG